MNAPEHHDVSAVRKTDGREVTTSAALRQFFSEYDARPQGGRTDSEEETLLLAERFVAKIVASSESGFTIGQTKHGKLCIKPLSLAQAHFRHLNAYLGRYQAGVFYSPLLTLFFESCRELNLLDYHFIVPDAVDGDGILHAERFNALIERVRAKGNTPQFKKAVSRRFGKRLAGFIGLVDYVDSLFERVRSRLIVIRLELKYRPEVGRTISVRQAKADLKHFCDNRRNKPSLFDDLVGYIWKIEQGTLGGVHFHVFLFFAGGEFQNDCRRARLIGEYWANVVAPGRGSYFNCNSPDEKARFDRLGRLAIGRVDHFDAKMRFSLLFPLAYVCKEDQALREKPKASSRSYGKGVLPKDRGGASTGRPRKQVECDQGYVAL